ncbi:MAG: hypothetical protein HY240_04975 [Actinobacteria bacterium]|nr:hypothetical protein [Actinomycetota bacterium]
MIQKDLEKVMGHEDHITTGSTSRLARIPPEPHDEHLGDGDPSGLDHSPAVLLDAGVPHG